MILTGPNAGGKSTLIKSVLISIVLSQTLTITNSVETTLTPFHFINSQINIPDCKGRYSLFEGEMIRSKSNLDRIQGSGFSFLAIDEIFSSTNPVEGIAGGFAIAKRLAENTNLLSIISTHHSYLTKLKSNTDKFQNYKMNVLMDDLGNITGYPYKLRRGVSNQFVALELLKQNGFDDQIIKYALEIKRDILQRV